MNGRWRAGAGRAPWSLKLSVLCWLVPGVWSGLGTLIPSLFVPPGIRDSGWFGSGILALLAGYTLVVIVVPILMLYRSRVARALLSVAAAWFAVAVITASFTVPMWAFIPVTLGTVLMWIPASNRYLRKRVLVGNGAVL